MGLSNTFVLTFFTVRNGIVRPFTAGALPFRALAGVVGFPFDPRFPEVLPPTVLPGVVVLPAASSSSLRSDGLLLSLSTSAMAVVVARPLVCCGFCCCAESVQVLRIVKHGEIAENINDRHV